MAKYLKRAEGISVSHNFIAAVWRDHELQPQRQGTFKLSTDPDFEVKVADVVGLYLDPPVGAVVLSIDEKTQALDRTQPVLPIDFAKTEKRTHDYVRHGTTNLSAALDTATGEVLGESYQRRRTTEFLTFMDKVVQASCGDGVWLQCLSSCRTRAERGTRQDQGPIGALGRSTAGAVMIGPPTSVGWRSPGRGPPAAC